MTLGLTGIAALEAEMRDRLADKNAEIERLREGYRRIRQATLDGTVGPDVAWFYGNETLHDFCERMAGDSL